MIRVDEENVEDEGVDYLVLMQLLLVVVNVVEVEKWNVGMQQPDGGERETLHFLPSKRHGCAGWSI